VKIVQKAIQGFRDFRKGLSVIFGKPTPGKGDRKLARVATLIEAQVDSHNKHAVRKNVIKDIERVLSNEAKKGGKVAVDAKVASALATPEYAHMLHRIGLEESHVRIIAMEALKNGKK